MRLCDDRLPLQDALESLTAVIAFLGAALCGERAHPWEDMTALWGAQIIFDALAADMEELRTRLTD